MQLRYFIWILNNLIYNHSIKSEPLKLLKIVVVMDCALSPSQYLIFFPFIMAGYFLFFWCKWNYHHAIYYFNFLFLYTFFKTNIKFSSRLEIQTFDLFLSSLSILYSVFYILKKNIKKSLSIGNTISLLLKNLFKAFVCCKLIQLKIWFFKLNLFWYLLEGSLF